MAESNDLPISLPVIKIGGEECVLRMTPAATMRLHRLGIEVSDIQATAEKWKAEGRAMEFTFSMIASIVSKKVGESWKHVEIAVEELAEQYTFEDLPMLTALVTQSIKARPAASTAETTPAQPPQVQ